MAVDRPAARVSIRRVSGRASSSEPAAGVASLDACPACGHCAPPSAAGDALICAECGQRFVVGESVWSVALQAGEHRTRQTRWIQLVLLSQTLMTVGALCMLQRRLISDRFFEDSVGEPLLGRTVYRAVFENGSRLLPIVAAALAVVAQWSLLRCWMRRDPPVSVAWRLLLGSVMGLSILSVAVWVIFFPRPEFIIGIALLVFGDSLFYIISILQACLEACAAATILVGTLGNQRGAPVAARRLAALVVASTIGIAALTITGLKDLTGTRGANTAGSHIPLGQILELADILLQAVVAASSVALTLVFATATRALREPLPDRSLSPNAFRRLTAAMCVGSAALFSASVIFARRTEFGGGWSGDSMAEVCTPALACFCTCMLLAWTVPWVYARDRQIWKAMLLCPLTAAAALTALLAITG